MRVGSIDNVRSTKPGLARLARVAIVVAASWMLGGCVDPVRDESPAVESAAASAGTGERRCETMERSADIGTTRTTRCLVDLDRDGVADVQHITTVVDYSTPASSCVRLVRGSDGWRRSGSCPVDAAR